MKKIYALLGFLICFAGVQGLSGCASRTVAHGPLSYGALTPDLDMLRDLSVSDNPSEDISHIRYTALRDAALSLGARGGLAERTQALNKVIEQRWHTLDRVFNFQSLMLDNHIVPPVLIEGRDAMDMINAETLRTADRTYRIYSQARFVSAPPSWRDYLLMTYDAPELPDRSLLPRNKTEQLLWSRFVQQGWQAGLNQADVIYQENLNRLTRDLNGMVRYRHLLAQNMVSEPFVAEVDMGITGDDSSLSIGDRVLRITSLPGLKHPDSAQWDSAIQTFQRPEVIFHHDK